MEFFNSAVGVLQTLVVALGAGLGIWGVINLLEGYGQGQPWLPMLMLHREAQQNRTRTVSPAAIPSKANYRVKSKKHL